jgi:sugar/nucleoside kinase (ribokinase family)
MTNRFDVLGIGNAIVDVLAHADDAFLARHGLAKGTMTLVEAEQARTLYEAMGPAIEISGGSAANTIAGLAALGARSAFIGKLRDDQLGDVFDHDIRALGVTFRTPRAREGAPSARCLVLVTPDAQRTMATYLGASTGLGPDDIDPDLIGAARIVYLEGYLWDPPAAKEAFRHAARLAHAAGGQVALSLSDPFCVARHRADFLRLIESEVDILFANEAEITALYETDNFEHALRLLRAQCRMAALTRSEKGSVILADEAVHVVPAEPVERVVDTTGAGDLYAAGFLYGLTQGRDLATCGRLGSLIAAEVLTHFGARPDTDLRKLVADRGL